MRIIAGEAGGRRLKAPEDDRIRPTSDKVREAVFNMLQMYVQDSVVADVFCGTGGLGLEALSRGAGKCYFFDNSRKSMALTEENIRTCRMEDRAVTSVCDFRKAVAQLAEPVDIVFLDPPYETGMLQECIEILAGSGKVKKGGLIVAEHPKTEDLPDEYFGFEKIREKKYGMIMVTIYRK
ncbi:MAG: 16S rRNA (guanine(966)-N(2))-methyltransferase RsmD [Firmicutes bacterium]|nr:16S rRNA (guanine(966)-N(2))-methyltransferase RsmD [Bacillota bacterium]